MQKNSDLQKHVIQRYIIFSLFLALLSLSKGILLAQVEEPEDIPIAQIRVEEFSSLYEEANFESDISGRVRPGDVLYIYAYDDSRTLGRTEKGWIDLFAGTPEAAVVSYEVVFDTQDALIEMPLLDSPGGDLTLMATWSGDVMVGIVALQDEWAFIYTVDHAGWVLLADIKKAGGEIQSASQDLRELIEQRAYVKTSDIQLYQEPDTHSEVQGVLLLGDEARIVYETEGWVLVRGENTAGWSPVNVFDRELRVQARGIVNTGPVNFRMTPGDGAVLWGLSYQEEVLILGQDDSGEWLYIRVYHNEIRQDGWVAAEFIDSEIEPDTGNLPVVEVGEGEQE